MAFMRFSWFNDYLFKPGGKEHFAQSDFSISLFVLCGLLSNGAANDVPLSARLHTQLTVCVCVSTVHTKMWRGKISASNSRGY